MFILSPKPDREMKVMLRGITMKMGKTPPHWELYAAINPTRFKMFMQEINYLSGHERIDPDFFTFLRYHIASTEGFAYCEHFNHAYLLTKGYTSAQLEVLHTDKEALPLDEKHKALFVASVDAMAHPEDFTTDTLSGLYALGWSDADIFDAVDHAAFLFKFSKILSVYLRDA